MTLPEEKLLDPKPTIPGGDNYTYNVLNLYKMYNDYGHFFFWCSLQKSQLPQILEDEKEDLTDQHTALQREQERVIKHYNFVSRTARHVLAHGIFQLPFIINSYNDPKISDMERIFGEVLSERSWPENGNDWKTINRWLVSEADFVYDWIKRWALLWDHCPGEKEELQQKFYYGRWEYSRNKDECRLTGDMEKALGDYNGTSFYIYEDGNKDLTSFAMAFPFQRIMDAKDYLIAATPNCVRSQYENENGVYWRSDKPDVNLKALYKSINFDGIENARNQLLHPKVPMSFCPDAFKLYLEGLINKMVKLPVIETRSKATSRLRR